MRKPEIEFIRFSGSDVVAASTAVPQTMTATGFGNGQAGDFKVNYGGEDFGYSDQIRLNTLLKNNGQTASVHTSYGLTTTLWKIFSADKEGDTSSRTISGFDWDSTNNRWNSKQ